MTVEKNISFRRTENDYELASVICHVLMIVLKFFDIVNSNIKITYPCLQFI